MTNTLTAHPALPLWMAIYFIQSQWNVFVTPVIQIGVARLITLKM